MTTLTETIQTHIQALPPVLQREALDFIEFLEQRYRKVQTTSNAPDDTEAFLAAVAGTWGDDFPNDITNDDLGVDAPREAMD